MHRTSFLLSIIMMLILSGCASGAAKKAPPSTPLASLGDNALVFGNLKWFENDENKRRTISLGIMRAEDMKKGTIKVEKDGRFYAVVPKGTYIIHRIDWRDPWDGPHWFVPQVSFKIANNQHAYYVGTLVVEIETARDILGSLLIKGVTVHIEDEEGAAMEAFNIKYPNQEIEIAKTLMVHDTSIPRIEDGR